MCYTGFKLENKTKILTNNKQKTKRKTKMAEKLNLPKQVINTNWRDDVDIDYAIYGDSEKGEREYISPNKISKESIARIKRRNQKIGSLFTGRFEKMVS